MNEGQNSSNKNGINKSVDHKVTFSNTDPNLTPLNKRRKSQTNLISSDPTNPPERSTTFHQSTITRITPSNSRPFVAAHSDDSINFAESFINYHGPSKSIENPAKDNSASDTSPQSNPPPTISSPSSASKKPRKSDKKKRKKIQAKPNENRSSSPPSSSPQEIKDRKKRRLRRHSNEDDFEWQDSGIEKVHDSQRKRSKSEPSENRQHRHHRRHHRSSSSSRRTPIESDSTRRRKRVHRKRLSKPSQPPLKEKTTSHLRGPRGLLSMFGIESDADWEKLMEDGQDELAALRQKKSQKGRKEAEIRQANEGDLGDTQNSQKNDSALENPSSESRQKKTRTVSNEKVAPLFLCATENSQNSDCAGESGKTADFSPSMQQSTINRKPAFGSISSMLQFQPPPRPTSAHGELGQRLIKTPSDGQKLFSRTPPLAASSRVHAWSPLMFKQGMHETNQGDGASVAVLDDLNKQPFFDQFSSPPRIRVKQPVAKQAPMNSHSSNIAVPKKRRASSNGFFAASNDKFNENAFFNSNFQNGNRNFNENANFNSNSNENFNSDEIENENFNANKDEKEEEEEIVLPPNSTRYGSFVFVSDDDDDIFIEDEEEEEEEEDTIASFRDLNDTAKLKPVTSGYKLYVYKGGHNKNENITFRKICMKYGLSSWEIMTRYLPWRTRSDLRLTLMKMLKKQAIGEYRNTRADPASICRDNEDLSGQHYKLKNGVWVNTKWNQRPEEKKIIRMKNKQKYHINTREAMKIQIVPILNMEFVVQKMMMRKQNLLLYDAALRAELRRRGVDVEKALKESEEEDENSSIRKNRRKRRVRFFNKKVDNKKVEDNLNGMRFIRNKNCRPKSHGIPLKFTKDLTGTVFVVANFDD